MSSQSSHRLQHQQPYIFQDARRPQPALVQHTLRHVVAKIQDVILPHEHYKLLIVRAKGSVTVDKTLDEPQEESDKGGLHSYVGQEPPPCHTCPSGEFCSAHAASCSNELELVAS